MAEYHWNSAKNEKLKRERGIGFEDIVYSIAAGNELAAYRHPNREKYPNQKISVVLVDDYVYVVPYMQDGNEVHLITIFPSRKLTKKYKGGQ